MLQAKEERERQEDAKRAYFVSILVNPHLKTALTTSQILEPMHPKSEYSIRSKEQRVKDEEALQEIFKEILH